MIEFFETVGALYLGAIDSRTGSIVTRVLIRLWSCSLVRTPSNGQALVPIMGPRQFRPFDCRALRLSPTVLWRTFTEIVDGPTNPKVNPLYHERSNTCSCAVCVLRDGPQGLANL